MLFRWKCWKEIKKKLKISSPPTTQVKIIWWWFWWSLYEKKEYECLLYFAFWWWHFAFWWWQHIYTRRKNMNVFCIFATIFIFAINAASEVTRFWFMLQFGKKVIRVRNCPDMTKWKSIFVLTSLWSSVWREPNLQNQSWKFE